MKKTQRRDQMKLLCYLIHVLTFLYYVYFEADEFTLYGEQFPPSGQGGGSREREDEF